MLPEALVHRASLRTVALMSLGVSLSGNSTLYQPGFPSTEAEKASFFPSGLKIRFVSRVSCRLIRRRR